MGGSSYSDDFYKARVTTRAAKGAPTFAHHAAINSGTVAAGVHDMLNIKGKIRESRDSDAHPESLAIAVIFDETGSMGTVPRALQQKIPSLMGLVLRKGYVKDPQILFGAVGDYYSDRAPIQIGQFESGIEMDDCITNIYLEGNGGGQNKESYQNIFYYFANRTSIDCHEKRGKKGYLFVIGDEHPYPTSSIKELEELVGVTEQAPVPVEASIAKCQEKYHVFFVIPQGSSYSNDPALKNHWKELLGPENVISLDDNEAVCETIATTIGLIEGTVDMLDIPAHLKDVGASDAVVGTVTTSLTSLANSVALAKVGSAVGDLPVRDTGAARL